MIIHAKAPYRVSFFGGGTDYPPYYLQHGGSVISTTINKHINLFLKQSSSFSRNRYIIKYSQIEMVDSINEIYHPVVKAVFSHFDLHEGVELNIMSDAPAGSGLGSSSVFTVALLGAVLCLKGLNYSNLDIARLAIMVEQELLGEKVGSQDQYASAVGGFNHIRFEKSGLIEHTPIYLPHKKSDQFFDNLYLVYTKATRKNETVTLEQDKKLQKGQLDEYMVEMKKLTINAKQLLLDLHFDEFGMLLNSAWDIKKNFATNVTIPEIDELYDFGIGNGALGGKLLGAGNGGFVLFYVPEANRLSFENAILKSGRPFSKLRSDFFGLTTKILN